MSNKIALEPSHFEKINSQLEGLHQEISVLSKKNPDGAVNKFKINHINSVLDEANKLLMGRYMPLKGFNNFDVDELPSNSDIVFVLMQYLMCMEQLRSDNIVFDLGEWFWKIDGELTDVRTGQPKKLEK